LLMRDSSPASLPHSFDLPFVLPETTLTMWSLLTDIEEGMISGVVGRGIRSTEATIGGIPGQCRERKEADQSNGETMSDRYAAQITIGGETQQNRMATLSNPNTRRRS
jgi:hypothetical protein